MNLIFLQADVHRSDCRIESCVEESNYRVHDCATPPDYFTVDTKDKKEVWGTRNHRNSRKYGADTVHRLGVVVERPISIRCARDCQPNQRKTEDGFPRFAHQTDFFRRPTNAAP